MEATPLIKEVTINAPASKVWKAITDKNDMKQWYFDIAAFEPEVGFEFQFEAGGNNRQYLHLCKITEVVPNKKLSYTWRYEDEPDVITHVTFELFEESGQTTVKLTHEGLEKFPADKADFARHNFVAGWDALIGKNLKEFAEK